MKYVLFSTKCECCGEEYKQEKMWQFDRWGINKSVHRWHFCQNCMHSAEEVLNEIDTDEYPFGLVWVDSFNFHKKDYTRMDAVMNKAFGCSAQ